MAMCDEVSVVPQVSITTAKWIVELGSALRLYIAITSPLKFTFNIFLFLFPFLTDAVVQCLSIHLSSEWTRRLVNVEESIEEYKARPRRLHLHKLLHGCQWLVIIKQTRCQMWNLPLHV